MNLSVYLFRSGVQELVWGDRQDGFTFLPTADSHNPPAPLSTGSSVLETYLKSPSPVML